jgi:hypothetical protein
LTKEFLLVAKAYYVDEKKLASILLNSVEQMFDPSEETKSLLRKEILGMNSRERAET